MHSWLNDTEQKQNKQVCSLVGHLDRFQALVLALVQAHRVLAQVLNRGNNLP